MQRKTVLLCELSNHYDAEKIKACSRVGEHMLNEHSIVSVLTLTEHDRQMENCLQAGKVRTV